MNTSCENQQQLLGDQTSLEYILSCSNRSNNKNEDIQSMLTRTARIAKVKEMIQSFIFFSPFLLERSLRNCMNYISMKKNN